MSELLDEYCAGAGNCHGCLKWCDTCGDVGAVCTFSGCMAHTCESCNEHPVSVTDYWCGPCTEREEARVAAERQTERIERAENLLLDMYKYNYSEKAIERQAAYLKAVMNGYHRSGWDFMKEHYFRENAE